MAVRPVFVPVLTGSSFVQEVDVEFSWNPGFAPIQKKRNIEALHAAAVLKGLNPVLEISTKSDRKLGMRLSAFNLRVQMEDGREIPLESAYQGSKVFSAGGPYQDIYAKGSREARKDERIRASGRIVAFRFGEADFPATPLTGFYDWLYVRALAPHRDYLRCLDEFAGFTDIEFNPGKSLSCQARSCALFVSLNRRGLLPDALASTRRFVDLIENGVFVRSGSNSDQQQSLI